MPDFTIAKDMRTLAVTVNASATGDPELAKIRVGYIAYGPDEQTAYARASAISNEVIGSLHGAGIASEAIESERQLLAPVSAFQSEAIINRSVFGLQGKEARRFRSSQSWIVSCEAENAAQVLDAAVKAGANQSGSIDWSLDDLDSLTLQAIQAAVVKARRYAHAMAEGMGVTLGVLLFASNSASMPIRGDFGNLFLAPGATGAVAPKPLALGARKVTRSATVYAVFAIE